MRDLPPIDLHAHLDVDIAQFELRQLGATIFAVTRSLDEAGRATQRNDEQTIWGVGCHPGLVRVQKEFDRGLFNTLIKNTPFVGEIGLDGKSRVPMATQKATLETILRELGSNPRITSIHSYMATDSVVNILEKYPKIKGVVLHWWLGDAAETERAIELGCYFSVNASSVRRVDLLEQIPLDKLFVETDHPFGDRWNTRDARPGRVSAVEDELAKHYGKTPGEIRAVMWDNLARIASETGCTNLFPRRVRLQFLAR